LKAINLLILLLLLFSCETAVDWDFKPSQNGALAVEAIITNELKTQQIRLTLSYDELNGAAAPASGAQVRVSGEGENYPFTEDPGQPGVYRSAQPFAAQFFKEYTLEITWQGETYGASASMVQVLPMSKPTFRPAGLGRMTFAELPPLYSPHEQAMYEAVADWSHLGGPAPGRGKAYHYTLSSVDVSEVFRPDKETFTFPRFSIVTVRKHSLSDDFAAFCRALLLQTEWQGGVFDEDAASLPTNLSNGAMGYFAVCAVVEESVLAE
jgi:hypothetical protein